MQGSVLYFYSFYSDVCGYFLSVLADWHVILEQHMFNSYLSFPTTAYRNINSLTFFPNAWADYLIAVPECYTKVAETTFQVRLLSFIGSYYYAVFTNFLNWTLFNVMQITVEEFFNLFFSDDAIPFMESFHKRCGDKGSLTLF